MSHLCPGDDHWSATVEPCLADFGWKFQNAIFNIVPAGAFVVVALYRILALRRRKPLQQQSPFLGLAKAVTSILTALIDLAFLVSWCLDSYTDSPLTLWAAALRVSASLAICSLSWLEHRQTPGPSFLLQTYLLLVVPLNAVYLRALRLRLFPPILIGLSASHLFLRFLQLTLESLDKGTIAEYKGLEKPRNEQTYGLFGQRLMLWLLPLFRTGYRKKFDPEDLIPLDEELLSHKVWHLFDGRGRWKHPMTSKYALVWMCASHLKDDILFSAVPYVFYIACSVLKPFFVAWLLQFVAADPKRISDIRGYGLVLGTALAYGFAAIFQCWYSQCLARFSLHLRGFLTTVIYEKSLTLRSTGADEDSPVSLMNVDVERVLFGVSKLHDLWGGFVMTIIGLYLLYLQVGWAFLAPLVIIAFSTWMSGKAGKGVAPRQLAWSQATNARVDYLTDMLGYMKTIKMLGLPNVVEKAVARLRTEEIDAQKHIRRIMLWIWLTVMSITPLSTLLTFLAFGLLPRPEDQKFDTQRIFTSLAVLRLFVTPLLMVLQYWTMFISALACIERIQKFLQRDDFVDLRDSERPSAKDAKHNQYAPANGKTGIHNPDTEAKQSIQVINGTFGYNDNAPILQDTYVEFPSGKLTMVMGRVGSGKSTLIRSILGETRLIKGSLIMPDLEVAFCAQSPWLRNTSIRENIVGISEYDQAWYSRVVSCCSLDEDIAQFTERDDTMVGSKGVALSGGQKNRLSLARALYARKSILLLDDILSGLDSRTEQAIFKRVFGQHGLCRDLGATVILVTHSKRYLQDADKIVMLDSGKVAHQGSYGDLSSSNALEKISDADLSKDDIKESKIDTDDREAGQQNSEKAKIESGKSLAKKIAEQEVENSLESYKFFFQGFGWTNLTIFCATVAVSQVVQVSQSIWLEIWSAAQDPGRALYYIVFSVVSLSSLVIANILMRYYFLHMIPRLSLFVHMKQLDALMHATLAFVTATESGKIVNRFSQDINFVDGPIPMLWFNMVSLVFSVLCAVFLVLLASPHVAFAIPFVIIASYAIQRVYLRTSKQIRIIDIEAKAPLVTHLTETYAGLTTIRAFGWANKFSAKNFVFLEDAQLPYYLLASITNWMVLVMDLLITGLSTLVALMAVWLRSSVNPGYLGLALIGVMDLASSFRFLLQNWVQMDTTLGAIVRIKDFAEQTPRERADDSLKPPPGWPTAGEIEFKELTASYAPGGEQVLKDVTLKVPAGSEVGICGRSGSGKTSTIGTLFGLLHAEDGQVIIDGVDLECVPLQALRSNITVLPQDPFFMPHRKGGNTVRCNLWPWADKEDQHDKSGGKLGRTLDYSSIVSASAQHADSVHGSKADIPSDEAMGQALENVGLWQKFAEHEKEQRKKNEAETAATASTAAAPVEAGAGGVMINADASERTPLLATAASTTTEAVDLNPTARTVLNMRLDPREFLSHGERQLFCLARALLTKNRILVLDEATSSVDTKTESHILSLINEHFSAKNGWTKIAIAHRLNTILESADKIAVMGGGRVLEEGEPGELKNREGGVLRDMVGKGL